MQVAQALAREANGVPARRTGGAFGAEAGVAPCPCIRPTERKTPKETTRTCKKERSVRSLMGWTEIITGWSEARCCQLSAVGYQWAVVSSRKYTVLVALSFWAKRRTCFLMELFARVALGATAGTSRRKQVPLFSRN